VILAILVLLWARATRTPWRDLGFVRPANWARTVAAGILFGSAFKLVMKAVVMPLFGAEAANPAFQYLIGNTAALPGILWTVVFSAGFGEEVFFRGFLFERLGKLLGSSVVAKTVIVAATTIPFAAVHYSLQGWPGVQQAAIVGLVFGTIYAVTGRLWLLIVAHAAFDVTAVGIIYFDLESTVAHLVFPS
jgi:membrane protease YdiL (CAAX protease family)